MMGSVTERFGSICADPFAFTGTALREAAQNGTLLYIDIPAIALWLLNTPESAELLEFSEGEGLRFVAAVDEGFWIVRYGTLNDKPMEIIGTSAAVSYDMAASLFPALIGLIYTRGWAGDFEVLGWGLD